MPIRCPCGEMNPDNGQYCTRCGEKLVTQSASGTCPRCGRDNPSHIEYCGSCGEELDKGLAEHVATSEIELPSDIGTHNPYALLLLIAAPASLLLGVGCIAIGEEPFGIALCVLSLALFLRWYLTR